MESKSDDWRTPVGVVLVGKYRLVPIRKLGVKSTKYAAIATNTGQTTGISNSFCRLFLVEEMVR